MPGQETDPLIADVEPHKTIAKRVGKSVGSYSISNVIYYAGLYVATTYISQLDPNNPDKLATAGLINTTEMFALHTIWAAEFAAGVLMAPVLHSDKKKAGSILQHTMLYSALIALPVTAALCAVGPVYRILGVATQVANEVQSYYYRFAIGALPFVWLGAYEQFALATRHLGLVVAMPALYVGLYLALGYPMMYGLGSLAGSGLNGLAWARSISAWATFGVFTAWFATKGFRSTYNTFPMHNWFNKDLLSQISQVGKQIAITVGSEFLGLYALSLIAGSLLGNAALAALQANLAYLSLLVIVPITMAQSLGIEVGGANAQGKKDNAKRIGNVGLVLSQLLPFVATAIGVAVVLNNEFSKILFKPFLNVESEANTTTLGLASMSFLVNAISQFPDSLRNTAAGALRGVFDGFIPDTNTAMNTSVIYMGIATSALGLALGYTAGLSTTGLFLARGICMVASAAALADRWFVRSNAHNAGARQDSGIGRFLSCGFWKKPETASIPAAAGVASEISPSV